MLKIKCFYFSLITCKLLSRRILYNLFIRTYAQIHNLLNNIPIKWDKNFIDIRVCYQFLNRETKLKPGNSQTVSIKSVYLKINLKALDILQNGILLN